MPNCFISIHSLTRRLTSWQTVRWDLLLYFNSQPHKEADWPTRSRIKGTFNFNSQPHKEADNIPHVFQHWKDYFNSQPHKEADQFFCLTCIPKLISIHSLTRRLTFCRYRLSSYIRISIHSLTRRLTFPVSAAVQHEWYFNSQPHKEADVFIGHTED